MTVAFRLETPEDGAFLRGLVGATIMDELGAASWPEPMRSHLVGMQQTMRMQTVRARFPLGESVILLADGAAAGWMYTARLDDVVWLVEIMVAGEHRGKGIGGAAVRRVLGGAGGRPVRLKVNVTNSRGIRFYERLGFERAGGDEVQHLMEYRAAAVRRNKPQMNADERG